MPKFTYAELDTLGSNLNDLERLSEAAHVAAHSLYPDNSDESHTIADLIDVLEEIVKIAPAALATALDLQNRPRMEPAHDDLG